MVTSTIDETLTKPEIAYTHYRWVHFLAASWFFVDYSFICFACVGCKRSGTQQAFYIRVAARIVSH
jgi:hypothetical protein